MSDEHTCFTCKNKRRKDFFYYICSIENRVISHDESCERWEAEDEREYGC